MSQQTVRFSKVKHQARRTGKCPVCNKRVTRTRTFEQTVNPYNRNADGSVKTIIEVLASTQAQAHAWDADFTHEGCKP